MSVSSGSARARTLQCHSEAKLLTLNGGGSTIQLKPDNIEVKTGTYRNHAKVHSFVPGANEPISTHQGGSSLKNDQLDLKNALTFVLRSHPEDGRLIALEPYTLYKDGAEIDKGVTDAKGRIVIKDHKPSTKAYKVKLSNGNEFELPVHPKLSHADDKLAAKGYRAAQDDPQDRREHFQQRQDGEE